MPNKTTNVFVSYSHSDAFLVAPIVKLLRANQSLVFQDIDSIEPGKKWRKEIARGLAESDRVVLFWCDHANSSEEVTQEWKTAIELEKDLLPLLLDATALPPELSEYQWIDFQEIANSAHSMMTDDVLESAIYPTRSAVSIEENELDRTTIQQGTEVMLPRGSVGRSWGAALAVAALAIIVGTFVLNIRSSPPGVSELPSIESSAPSEPGQAPPQTPTGQSLINPEDSRQEKPAEFAPPPHVMLPEQEKQVSTLSKVILSQGAMLLCFALVFIAVVGGIIWLSHRVEKRSDSQESSDSDLHGAATSDEVTCENPSEMDLWAQHPTLVMHRLAREIEKEILRRAELGQTTATQPTSASESHN